MNATRPKNPVFNQGPVEVLTSVPPVPYGDAVDIMEERVADIATGRKSEMIWFLQHDPLYTAGTSAQENDLVDPDRFPVFKAGRGGQYTYHGPGQRIVYVMMDLKKRGRDVRAFVCALEDWIIETLAEFGIESGRRDGRIGVWVVKPDGTDAKIAALGIRIRRWVSFHGISINLDPDLSHFTGIVPCGIKQHGVTSFSDLGIDATMADLDDALKRHFTSRFGPLDLPGAG